MSERKPCPFHNCLTCACVDEVDMSVKDWNTRPIEDALHARIAELEAEIAKMKKYFHKPAHGTCCTCQKCGHTYDECRCDFDEALDDLDKANARIADLSQAVGLITTLKPTMVMDANHPLDMVREVAEHVTARIAELEYQLEDWTNNGWAEDYKARIAEIEAYIDQLIEIGGWAITGMTIATSYSPSEMQNLAEKKSDDWYALIKNLKECDKEKEREE